MRLGVSFPTEEIFKVGCIYIGKVVFVQVIDAPEFNDIMDKRSTES
jgi:hypothetical protein